MKEKKEFLFKVLVIGDLGTGKTSIIKRYVHQFFSIHYRATVSFLMFDQQYGNSTVGVRYDIHLFVCIQGH